MSTATTIVTGVDFVSIPTRDVSAAADFYENVLGLERSIAWQRPGEEPLGVEFETGAVTIAPLLMFASAAQRIPLLWIGLLQYIAPTLQLGIGVLVFGEPFDRERAIGFSLVWAALVVFAVEGLVAHRAAAVEPLPD